MGGITVEKAILTLIFLTIAMPLFAEELIIFTGVPEVKISEGGISRVPESLTEDKAMKAKCTVSKI